MSRLSPSFALETGSSRLGVAGGVIDAADTVPAATFRIRCAELRPGLINAHDHLAFNHYPRLGAPPYRSLYEWANDVHTRFAGEVERARRIPTRDALLFGALKNLVGATTRVVHHDRWYADLDADFPLRVERVRVLHSLRLERHPERATDPALADRPLCIHLAEGTGAIAASEVREADRRRLLGPDVLAVHLVGAGEADAALLRRRGCAFVCCPSSNLHLYGRVPPPAMFDAGLDLLLGTDALISGAGTLLDELRLVHHLALTDDATLSAAVGATAARRLGQPEPTLAPGRPADLVALRKPLLEARLEDVALVLVGGAPRYGDAELAPLFELAGVRFEPLWVAGEERLVVAPLASVAERVRKTTGMMIRGVQTRLESTP